MPVTRPDYWPLVALTPLANFAIPPSGVILQGWGIGAVFPSRDANWLFRQHGDWLKYTDARALHGADGLDPSVVQRVSSTQLDFPTGAGLQVAPSSGGVYIIGGERVDLSDAPGTYTGVMAPTFAPSTTNYVHARLMPDTGGMVTIGSVGDLLVSTNIAEAGYSLILSVATDATDITATGEPGSLVLGYRWANPWQFADDVDMADLVVNNALFFGRAVGSGVAGFNTLSLSPGDATVKALSAIGFTADDLVHITQTGAGLALNVTGSATSTAAAITGGAGQAALLVTGGNNAAIAMQVLGSGTSLGFVASGGAGASTATGIRGDAVHKDATGVHGRTSVTPSAIAAGVTGEARAAGSSGVHANGGTVGRGLLVRADTGGTPDYPAMRIIPQSADPASATQDGEVYWSSDHKTLRTCVATYGYRSIPTMGPGSAMIVNATSATTTAVPVAGGGVIWTPVLTVTCSTLNGTGVYGQAAGAEVLISVSFDVRTNTGATNYVQVGLVDVTNGNSDIARWAGAGTGGSNGFFLAAPVTDWQRTVVCNVRYPILSDGDLEVLLEIGNTGAAGEVRNVSLTITGTF